MEPSELEALVGRWARLRPVDGAEVVDVLPPGVRRLRPPERQPGGATVEVAVVGGVGRSLRAETRDQRAIQLDGHQVMVELGASQAMLRVPARVRVLVERPLPVVVALETSGPLEHLQRRHWVRAVVQVPVEVAAEGSYAEGRFRATTVDLSGGGARLRTSEALQPGQDVRLTLWLPDGPVEVDAAVVGVAGDGTARVSFARAPEAVVKRLVRFVFDVQIRGHRLAGP